MILAITFEAVCSGGNHVTIGATVNAGPKRSAEFSIDELRDDLSAAEREDLMRLIVRAALTGLTKAQARSKLQAGFVVTL